MKNPDLEIKQIVTNIHTGEIVKETSQFKEAVFNSTGYLFWLKKHSIRFFIGERLPSEFNWAEQGKIHNIMRYIVNNQQYLGYKNNKGEIIPLTSFDISKIFEIDIKHARRLIKKMKEKNVIKVIKTKNNIKFLVFNPIYCMRGNRLSKELYFLFKEQLNEILPIWAIKKFNDILEEEGVEHH